jgi:transcriptional regulator with XRE-family HTH domain
VKDTPESGDSLSREVAAVIARLRREEGWTLEELADRSGLHRTSLGLIERGERSMTLGSAHAVAEALGTQLSLIVSLAESAGSPQVARTPRRLPPETSSNEVKVERLCGLTGAMIREAIEDTYDTLDLIDAQLLEAGSEPIAGLVELANLSSMIGNLLGAGLAGASAGQYVRNRPHAFPDLVPQNRHLPDLELKMALETNSPKGHLAKAGMYITFRYVLGNADGTYVRGREGRGQTAWIWEVRIGHLNLNDFSLSNTAGDSGKTAVIKTQSFKGMTLAFQDNRFYPYARQWA